MQVARQSTITDADIFILSKNDKLKLLGAVRYVWWHKKGVTAHRAAPLADSPTSIQVAQTLKRKAATVESQNTNLIARANSSSKHFCCKGTKKI